jgi:hypothetical protein
MPMEWRNTISLQLVQQALNNSSRLYAAATEAMPWPIFLLFNNWHHTWSLVFKISACILTFHFQHCWRWLICQLSHPPHPLPPPIGSILGLKYDE